jgi:hypothetical protein
VGALESFPDGNRSAMDTERPCANSTLISKKEVRVWVRVLMMDTAVLNKEGVPEVRRQPAGANVASDFESLNRSIVNRDSDRDPDLRRIS